jgi:hypothetical protein
MAHPLRVRQLKPGDYSPGYDTPRRATPCGLHIVLLKKETTFFMKKITYIFALLALTACSNDDVIQTTSSDEIRLSVTTDYGTLGTTSRGLHDGSTTAVKTAMAAFKLFAVKTTPSSGLTFEKYIDNADVVYDDSSWKFANDKRYFWPTNDKLNFYAYHFANANETEPGIELNKFDSAGFNYDSTNDVVTFKLKGVEPLIATNFTLADGLSIENLNTYQDDLLYAAALSKARSYSVPINFRHALSQIHLGVSVDASSPNLVVYIPQGGITICGFNNKGDLTFGTTATDTNFAKNKTNDNYAYSSDCAWTFDSSENLAANYTYLDYQAATLLSSAAAFTATSFKPALLIPQTWNTSYTDSWDGVVYLKIKCYVASIDNADERDYITNYAATTDPTAAIFNGTDDHSACGVLLYGDPTDATHLKELYVPLPNGKWEAGKKYIYNLVFNTTPGSGPATDTDGNPIEKVGIDLNVTTADWLNGNVNDFGGTAVPDLNL